MRIASSALVAYLHRWALWSSSAVEPLSTSRLVKEGGCKMATVLVVEDEFLVRNFLQIELEDAGYDVVLADKARTDIHLVFTDIDMPGSMDGLKLAACVRDRWPPIHIIITTGNARPLEIPANALFIPKPYIGRTVIDAMRTFEKM
jgi:two-component system, response regulator PdtaR